MVKRSRALWLAKQFPRAQRDLELGCIGSDKVYELSNQAILCADTPDGACAAG